MADGGGNKSKEISAYLKVAKDAIKQKEYKEAAKNCRNVLKLDKTNYHAFVFIGLCAKEMGQHEQSRAAYNKAIEHSPDQILAWQGLCRLYEATSYDEWRNEMQLENWEQERVNVYTKLISTNKNDLTRWKELLAKVIPLQLSLGLATEALRSLKDLEGATPEPSEELLILWKKCLELFQSKAKKNELSSELQSQMENVFQSVMEYSRILGISTEDPQSSYLLFLSTTIKEIKEKSQADFFEHQILEKGKAILEEYPKNVFALQLVVKFLMEQSGDISKEAMDYINKIDVIDTKNPWSVIGAAYNKYLSRDWMEAANFLNGIKKEMSEEYVPFYWLLLSKIHYCLHDQKLSLTYAEKGQKQVQKCQTETGRTVYSGAFNIRRAACYIESRNYEHAKELLAKVLETDSNNLEALNLLGTVFALLERNNDALEISTKISEIEPNHHGCLAVKALISINERKFYDAELRLQEAIELKSDVARYHFLLGKVYWNLRTCDNANAKKAHACFCEAAKLDLNNSAVFFALGEYYRDVVENLQKAQKCFKKAVSLDELNGEACLALGDVSLDLDDEDTAVDIYERTTRNFGPGRVKDAWLRLGMLLTKRGNPEKAVSCFQGALQCDPADRHLWECLGDAFIARGSYNPAMKAFQKAAEIDPSSIYCRYKIGVIKQSICIYAGAIAEFEKVIALQDDYIPAIKGIADCHLRLQYSSINENFDGRAIQHAEKVLAASAKAIEIRPDLHCFWKNVGDACFALGVIAEEKLKFVFPLKDSVEIPASLSKVVGLKIAENQRKKSALLDLSRRCFAIIVKLEETSANAWHDFALSSFHYGMSLGGETGKSTIQQSVNLIKKAISLEPQNYKMWNTLGVISASSDIANPELSQHAFIKALQLEPQNAEVWTNLGTLYLKYNKVKEAHGAFKKAQDADPSYTPAWVGQATIAEIMGDEDAMDLFRHSSELGSNSEGFLAYAKWVCFELKAYYSKMKPSLWKVDSLQLPRSIRKAIANSSVCAQKHTERNYGNPCAFNLFGVLLEHQKLFKQAEKSFKSAFSSVSGDDDVDKRNMILSNLARVQRQSGQYKGSIETYSEIKPFVNPDDVTGLALSYYLNDQLEESLRTYEQALNLTDNERDRSDIFVAMGMIAYTAGNLELAKSFLLQSSQTNFPCGHGLVALSALGLLTKNHALADAALFEIKKHPDFRTEPMEESYAYLNSAMSLLQGDIIGAKRKLQSALIRYPGSSRIWNRLATFIYQRAPTLPLHVAGQCAQVASEHDPADLSLMITSAASLGAKSFATTLSNKQHYLASLRAAQKAVHSNPDKPENWILLATAALAKSVSIDDQYSSLTAISTARLALLKAEENLSRLEEALKSTASRRLSAKVKIAVNLRVHAIQTLIWAKLHDGNYEVALLLSDNAASQYESDPVVSKELVYLKIISEMLWKLKCGDESAKDLLSSAKLICDADNDSIRKYKVISNVSQHLGLPLVSEMAMRKCIQLAIQNGLPAVKYNSLIRLALMSIKCFSKDKTETWFNLATEALTEAAKLKPGDYLIDFLRTSLFHTKGDSKKVQKMLGRLEKRDDEVYMQVTNYWHSIYCVDEQKGIADRDLYECQNWT